MKTYFKQNNIKYQLAPPGQHRTNAAERAIRTFKNHLIAGLCSLDDDFPIHLHSKPDQRKTWDPHAKEGWYIGPAPEHYRCYRVYMTETKAERISDTISWYPTKTIMPTADSIEIIGAAINDIHQELCNQRPTNSICALDEQQREAIKTFTRTFKSVLDPNNRFTYLSDEDDDDSSTTDTAANPKEPVPKSPTILQPSIISINPAAPQRVTNVSVPETPHLSPTPQRVLTEAQIDIAMEAPNTSRTHAITTPVPHELPPQPQPTIVDTIAAENNGTWPLPTRFTHGHYTRASAKIAYILANAPQYAFFGNAINPDTGRPAEYYELSQSSRGPKWIDGMTLEIGKLLGTETMKFIPVSAIPHGTPITLCRISLLERRSQRNQHHVSQTQCTSPRQRQHYQGNSRQRSGSGTRRFIS
jgi:hypothetical protein